MSRTPAQIEASKRNGAKSAGPKTAEGRQRSSRNATRHGLSAHKLVVIAGEDEDEWREFHDSFIAKFQPRDTVEDHLVLEMAVNRWRLQRCWTLQAAAMDDEACNQQEIVEEQYEEYDNALIHSCSYRARKDELASLGQMEVRLSRGFDRALKQYNAIRAEYVPIAIPESESEPVSTPQPEPESDPAKAQPVISENEPENPVAASGISLCRSDRVVESAANIPALYSSPVEENDETPANRRVA